MSGHTPGPWTVGADNVVYDERHRDPICDASYRGEEVSAANSNLIAAAPDLLEALIAIESAYSQATNWEHAGSTDRNPQLTGPVAIAARKAIARAKGEA